MKVCVIGAGIVGCATAYQLASLGLKVHLMESRGEVGTQTSFANGAQLSYSYVEPFASPATLRSLPAMLLSSESPVRFRLRADWRQWAWGLRFLTACTKRRAQAGTLNLLELAQLSRATLTEWMLREHWSFEFKQNGKLVMCPDLDTLRRQGAQVRFQASHGCQQEILNMRQCLQREPTLEAVAGKFAGGVWTADECVGDPYLLCSEMVKSVRSKGGEVHFNSPVSGFVRREEQFMAAITPNGQIDADAFVLATGPHAASLASTFGLYLPIYPIKGYSITVPMRRENRPCVSVTDLARKTVFAPLGSQLRVAAMAEISGYGMNIPEEHIEDLVRSTAATYPGLCDVSAPMAWAGLRPCTPSSVPIIGQIGASNMYVNVGHGALGLTLAAGSAARLASLLRH